MSQYGTCSLCGEEILDADLRDRRHQAVGWYPDLKRKGGGEHTKGKYSRDTGALAHGRCVEEAHRKAKRGIPVKQTGLF